MKKFVLGFSAAVFLFACNNNGTSKTNTDTGSTPNLTNVQNVNGNQPDTSGGITLDKKNTTDSTHH